MCDRAYPVAPQPSTLIQMFRLPDGFDLVASVGGHVYDHGRLARRSCARCQRPIPKCGGLLLRNAATGIEFVLGRSCLGGFSDDVDALRSARNGRIPQPAQRTPGELDRIEVYAGFRQQLKLIV